MALQANKTDGTQEKIKKLYLGKNNFEISCDLDTGARLTFIGKKDFEDFCKTQKNIQMIDLAYPIKIEVANNKFEYSRHAFVTKITIPFEESQVVLDNIVVYIVDGNWGSFLLSWPVLHSLGLTPEKNLAKYKGKNISLSYDQQMTVAFKIPKKSETVEEAQSNCAVVLKALKTKVITEKQANQVLQYLDFDDKDTKEGFVIVNENIDEEEKEKMYGKSEILASSKYVDYRDTKKRTKKHYALGAQGIEERVKQAHKRVDTAMERFKEKDKNAELIAKAFDLEPGEVIARNEGDIPSEELMDEGVLDTPEELNFEQALKKALDNAAVNGCTSLKRLEAILRKHEKIFAFKFEDCKISKVTKMEPELKTGANPVFAKPRRMNIEQLKWLEEHIKKMIDLGMLVEVRNPTWGVPVFVVPKPGGKGFRMVADFRAVNARSLANSLPMPLLEQLIGATKGASVYGSLDNMKGFNLLGVKNGDPFTLVTPFGCFQMLVAPQGYLNSPVVYQDRIVNEVLKELHMRSCVNWIDDCMVFGDSEEQYLDRLDQILDRYEKYDVKLNFAKCIFYAKKLVWCGREFDETGHRYDPKYYKKILQTPEPVLGQELHDFIFALGWIQDSLDPFETLEAKGVLTNFLNKLFEVKASQGSKASRKKKLLVGMKLVEYGWGEQEIKAFKKCLELIHKAIKLAVVDPEKELCLFTDASNVGCAIVITQCEADELEKPMKDQKHNIVFMTTHKWADVEKRWHISSQEAYPIIFALKRLDYLIGLRKINIFMDHKSLQYIFKPDKTTSKTTLSRLQRWALEIQANNYVIRHLKGEDNIVADLFSRWALSQTDEELIDDQPSAEAKVSRMLQRLQDHNKKGFKEKSVSESRRKKVKFTDEFDEVENIVHESELIKSEMPKPVMVSDKKPSSFMSISSRMNPSLSVSGDILEYPSKKDILKVQKDALKTKPKGAELASDGLYRVNGKIWIPKVISPVIVAIFHVACGHPGINTFMKLLQEHFLMDNLSSLIKDLNKYCLVCACEHLPRLMKRNQGEQLYSTQRNSILHLDFCYVKKEYILVIRDDFSGKVELFRCSSADAITAADALLWWRARFGINRNTMIVTDGGSHFANSLIKELCAKLKISHHIVVAYSPWSNGKVERVNSEFLKLLRSVGATIGHENLQEWFKLLPSVQYLLNNMPRKRLNGFSADQIFLGLKNNDPVSFLVVDDVAYGIKKVSTEGMKKALEELNSYLEQLHAEVIDVQYNIRRKHEGSQDPSLDCIQYTIGDFVLVSRATRRPDKLLFQWNGPFQIVDCLNPYVYRVRSLVNGKEMNVHTRRLAFYENKYLLTEDVRPHVLRSTRGFQLQKVISSRYSDREYELLCRWFGMEVEHDSWIGFQEVVANYPDMVDRYLLKAKPDNVVKALLLKRGL